MSCTPTSLSGTPKVHTSVCVGADLGAGKPHVEAKAGSARGTPVSVSRDAASFGGMVESEAHGASFVRKTKDEPRLAPNSTQRKRIHYEYLLTTPSAPAIRMLSNVI
jgi:hypothetical protein